MSDRCAPVIARVVTYGVVLVLVIAVALDAEWWPVSSMRLFSGERTSSSTSWEVDLVDATGIEHRLDLADLGPSFAGLDYFARHLPTMRRDRLDGICQAWADAAVDQGSVAAAEVRIYHLRRTVPTRRDEPRRLLERDLRYTCAGTSA